MKVLLSPALSRWSPALSYGVLRPDAQALSRPIFSGLWYRKGSDRIIVWVIRITFLDDFYVLLYHMLFEASGEGDEVCVFPVYMAQAHSVEVFEVVVHGEH